MLSVRRAAGPLRRSRWARVLALALAATVVVALAVHGRGARALSGWLIQQTFTGSSASGWTLMGDARLTASSGIDASGSGWLRLTRAQNDRVGAAWHTTAIPASGGVYVAFDWATWNGGASPADGIALVLYDGAVNNPSIGPGGGALASAGLCNDNGWTRSYLSIAVDEWGNYSSSSNGCPANGPGQDPDSVTIRGAGDNRSGYPYIAHGSVAAGVDVPARPTSTSDANHRRLHVSLVPAASGWTATVQVDTGSTRTTVIDRQPVPAPAYATLRVALTGSTGGALALHEVRNFVAAPAAYVAGTVFEDVNYGGGAGRARASAAGAVARPGARVELYTASGALLAATTTDSSGAYRFLVAANTRYQVRVVNGSVASSRPGASSALVPVQTFRVDGTSGTALAVTDRVGGESPSRVDAGNGATTLAALATSSTAAQSVATVDVPPLGIDDVDFGFNFGTVVSTRDAGQGSLRQAILNANALGGDASLAVAGRSAGVEHVVFMLPNGTAAPGLRASQDAFATPALAGRAATIVTASALPTIVGPLVVDAQTQPGWTLHPVVALRPSVDRAHDGIAMTGGGVVLRGLALHRYVEGIVATGAGDGYVIQGTWGGLDPDGVTASGHLNSAVWLNGSGNGHRVGGTSPAQRNVFAASVNYDGVAIAAGANHAVEGNFVGTTADGTAARGNARWGVVVYGGTGTTVGGAAAGAGNVVAGSGTTGVELRGGSGHRVLGNRIGTNATGTAALPNATGVAVRAAAGGVRVGDAGAGNLVSGNGGSGVVVEAAGTVVAGNTIGTDAGGATALRNGAHGVDVAADGATVGGTTAGAGNLISGNAQAGVRIAASNATVAGNTIGTDAAGGTAVGNGAAGAALGGVWVVSGSGTTIGGTTAAARNLISGNGGAGVWVDAPASGVVVQGNRIGTNAAGTAALGNGRWGVHLSGGTGHRVGGSASGAGNTIAGHVAAQTGGIYVSGTGQTIQGNTIGLNAAGTAALPNGDGATTYASGIDVRGGSGHLVGGTATGEGNTIAGNAGHGVRVSATGAGVVRILGNAIRDNLWLGIDLGADGPTANDGARTPGTPNLRIDHPVITAARARGSRLTVSGHVGSAPGQSTFGGVRVEVFEADGDASGHGEGRRWLGALTALADGRFSGTFTMPVAALAAGTRLAGTATDATAGTSEFGAAFAGLVVDQVVNHAGDAPDANPGDGTCQTAVVGQCTLRAALMEVNATPAGAPATIAFDLPGCPGAGCTIAPTTALPSVARAGTTIDAQSQPGWSRDPLVVLSGASSAATTGLAIAAPDVAVRGLVVGRWASVGVRVDAAGARATIEGNWLGLGADGTSAAPNGDGLSIAAADAVVGGASDAQRNLLSGNARSGLELAAGATGTRVLGNGFGLTAPGTAGRANGAHGLRALPGSSATIGGAGTGEGNRFGASGLDGASLAGSGGSVLGNTFGLGADGATPVPAGRHGVHVVAGAWAVGGTASGEANTIVGNGGIGVLVDTGARATIVRNVIAGNAGLGIDLGHVGAGGSGSGDGPTPNDGAYVAGAANDGVDAPVIDAAATDGATLTVQGRVGSVAGASTFAGARVELFRSDLDPSGRGEGAAYVGTLTAGADGRFSGTLPLAPGLLAVGQVLSATATDATGNTSEFGANAAVTTVAALRPSGFNAFEPTTAAGALAGPIRTMVAGRASTLDVIVLDTAGTGLHASFSGTVSLEWLDARDNGGAPDAGGCRPGWAAVGAAGSVAFTAGVARRGVSLVPPDAGREWRLRLRATLAGGTVVTACSTDAFAVRPDTLAITAAGDDTSSTAGTARSLLAPDAAGGVVHRAGRPFSIRAVARTATGATATGYDGTPSLQATGCTLPAAGCTLGALSFAATASSGQLASDTVTYGEVGAFSARLVDADFAAIDAADTPEADRVVQGADATIGRFVPDRYVLSQASAPQLATQQGACAAPGAGFTFVGQAFGWRTVPTVTVQAVAAAGAATANWAGALQRLAPADVAAAIAAPGAPSALQAAWGTPAVTDAGGGRATVSLSPADRFTFARDASAPVATFDAQPTLTVSVADASEAAVAGNGTIQGAPLALGGAGGVVAFDAGARIHHGRLVVQHAFGDARRPLEAPVEVQRYTDRGWLRLADAGTCVAVPLQAWSYTAGTGALAGGLECRAAASAGITLRDGRGALPLPKIADNRPAAMTLVLNAGTATEGSGCAAGSPAVAVPMNLPHLLTGRAGHPTLDRAPAARVVWGQPRQAWMARRELY